MKDKYESAVLVISNNSDLPCGYAYPLSYTVQTEPVGSEDRDSVFSETSVSTCNCTRLYDAEDQHCHPHRHENLSPHKQTSITDVRQLMKRQYTG
jgi:hypothetical protein